MSEIPCIFPGIREFDGGDSFAAVSPHSQLVSSFLALAQVLTLFAPHATLLRSGDGTLFKTGTFSGVRTLAGYADTAKHGRVRFVISLRSNDGAMRYRLLKAIKSGL